MLVIHFTQRLARHLRRRDLAAEPEAADTTTLREWYANLIQIGRRKRILFVNAATRLAVVVPVGPIEKMADVFRSRLAELLDLIGVHEDDIEAEIRATRDVTIARATDRSVLGTMNLIQRELPHIHDIAQHAGEDVEFAVESHFLHEIQSPLEWRCPAEVVRMAFAEMRPHVPPAEIARDYLQIEEVGPHEFEFWYERITPEVSEMLLAALEADTRCHTDVAHTMLAGLIRDYPEFIDAYHHLAALHVRAGDYDLAYDLWWYAVEIGRATLPDSFRVGTDRLRWGLLYNRPFLRACHGLALEWERRGVDERAIELYRDILEFNPEDNQGVRALLATAYLRQGDADAALAICDRFPDDTLPEVVYGRVLSLLRLGRPDDARRALTSAIDVRPLVAREIAGTLHIKPSPHTIERDYIAGSFEEAVYYWHDCGSLWESTPGALEFIGEYLEENPLPKRPKGKVIEFPGRGRE